MTIVNYLIGAFLSMAPAEGKLEQPVYQQVQQEALPAELVDKVGFGYLKQKAESASDPPHPLLDLYQDLRDGLTELGWVVDMNEPSLEIRLDGITEENVYHGMAVSMVNNFHMGPKYPLALIFMNLDTLTKDAYEASRNNLPDPGLVQFIFVDDYTGLEVADVDSFLKTGGPIETGTEQKTWSGLKKEFMKREMK